MPLWKGVLIVTPMWEGCYEEIKIFFSSYLILNHIFYLFQVFLIFVPLFSCCPFTSYVLIPCERKLWWLLLILFLIGRTANFICTSLFICLSFFLQKEIFFLLNIIYFNSHILIFNSISKSHVCLIFFLTFFSPFKWELKNKKNHFFLFSFLTVGHGDVVLKMETSVFCFSFQVASSKYHHHHHDYYYYYFFLFFLLENLTMEEVIGREICSDW